MKLRELFHRHDRFEKWDQSLALGAKSRNSYDDNDEDAMSISSHSTNSTIDDNIGPGRLMDKYMYQRGGRKLERLIFWARIRMPNLDPAYTLRYIESRYRANTYKGYVTSLRTSIYDIARNTNGSTVSGLKSLVQQTQSASLSRSSAALTALIRVSLRSMKCGGNEYHALHTFFLTIAREEPIFHVRSVATSLDESRVEKGWIFLLVQIAEANVVFLKRHKPPSHKTALYLRRQLLRVIMKRRLVKNDFLKCIGDACLIYAYAISHLISPKKGDERSVHIEETIHFVVVFLFQSIFDLYHDNRINFPALRTHQFVQMVFSALIIWLDAALCRYIKSLSNSNPGHWETRFSFLNLFHLYPLSNLFPNSEGRRVAYEDNCSSFIPQSYLPRNVRVNLEERYEYPRMFETSKRRSARRNVRLLNSSSELEWEVWDSCLRRSDTVHQMMEFGPISDGQRCGGHPHTAFAMYGAIRAHVQIIVTTSKIRTARNVLYECESGSKEDFRNKYDSEDSDLHVQLLQDQFLFGLYHWSRYKDDCYVRHKWEPYFRSNLDWDWDLAGCLMRLFRLDPPVLPIRSQRPAVDTETEELVGVQGHTWNVKSGAAKTELPNEVRIEYRTEAGESQYMTFVPKSPESSSGGKAFQLSDDPVAVCAEPPSSQDFVAQPECSQQNPKSPAGSSEDGTGEFADSLRPDEKTLARASTQASTLPRP